MADNQSSIVLNIGTQRVGLAVFDSNKSGDLVLQSFDSESIVADPASEGARVSQISLAIQQLVERNDVKGKARYAISGQSAFIRFVKLPPLDDDNIEQLVTFEAQQHVPFPLEEVVWDYEILEAGGDKEVVIVAIKSDALDETNESVNDTGLATKEVDVAPMALYNSFRAAYPDVDEPVLLIDLGAKTSDLLYIEGNRFFTRSANVGGASISVAIAKEFNVSFAEAEAHKTQSGLVALGGGHTEQLDESTAALAMCIRNAMSRLATEIPRTTNYYRSQHGGSAPKRVFLAGGGANLHYTKEFFEEKLRLPVEFYNPLTAIQVSETVDTDRLVKEGHMMGELIGLGVRGVGKSKINIDLVPTKVGEARAADKRKPFLIAASALIILGSLVYALLASSTAKTAQDEAKDAAKQQETLSGPAGKIKDQVQREAELKYIADAYTNADSARIFWIDAYRELTAAFASEFVWVTDFDPIADYDPLDESSASESVVKEGFDGVKYGDSPLVEVKVDNPAPGAEGEKILAPANAVVIRGFWLDSEQNTRRQNVISDLLANLKENAKEGSSHFKFTVTNEKGEEVPLEDSNYAKVDAAPAESDFAAPFVIILPLTEPVPYK